MVHKNASDLFRRFEITIRSLLEQREVYNYMVKF